MSVRSRAAAAARAARAVTAQHGDGSGPLLAVCTGHRCAALQRLAGRDDPVGWVRPAVVASPRAVLVSTDCLGACAWAPVAALGLHDGHGSATGPLAWVAGLDDPGRAAAVLAWASGDGPLPASRVAPWGDHAFQRRPPSGSSS